MFSIDNVRDPHPAAAPRDDVGSLVAPAPQFHDWDRTPHGIFPLVGLGHIELGDVVLGGTHQVDGIGRAEQRGAAAVRLDLVYLVGPTMEQSARLILPVDHQLEVKRYFPDTPGGHRYAWIKLDSEDHDYPPSLIPDYGDDVDRCAHNNAQNPDGYEAGTTLCDSCVESWDIDHEVIRHEAD